MRRPVYIYLALAMAACGPPDKRVPAPSATESEEPPPFDDVKDTEKILMGKWGSLVVPKEFEDDATAIAKLPDGTKVDIAYSRRTDTATLARLTVGHADQPGTAVPTPDLKTLPGGEVGGVACPGGSVDTADLVVKHGARAHVQCGRGSLGGGIVATLRKEGRVYTFVCTEPGPDGVAKCIAYLKTLDPA